MENTTRRNGPAAKEEIYTVEQFIEAWRNASPEARAEAKALLLKAQKPDAKAV